MRLMGRAKLVGVTRAPFIAEDGGVLKACDTTSGRRVGAVVVDVGPDQDKAIRRAERKARTYGKALLGLASLLCLSVCSNLVCSALSILVFKELPSSGATQLRAVVLSDSKAAAPVVTGLPSYGAEVRTYDKDTYPVGVSSTASVPGVKKPDAGLVLADSNKHAVPLKRCATEQWWDELPARLHSEACWELADRAMTDIPDDFLNGNTDLTGTLKVGPAVKAIGAGAFYNTKLTGLDLSDATSLVEIGVGAFYRTNLGGKLVIPAKVITVCAYAFAYTLLAGLDLSKATSLVEIGDDAFLSTDLGGTLVIPATVTTIGNSAFQDTELTALDLSKATALMPIGNFGFFGTIVASRDPTPFPFGVTIVSVPGANRCTIAPSGTACWELADPTMTDIPDNFLYGNTDLTGTFKVGPAVKAIGASAFANTKLTGLDLSEATSLVSIGDSAFFNAELTGLDLSKATALVSIGDNAFFSATDLEGTLAIPTTVTTIGDEAFANTKLAGLDLSKATSLVEIGAWAFGDTGLEGTLMIPTKVTKIGNSAFDNTILTGINLSKATALVEIGARAFGDTDLAGLRATSPMFALTVTELAAGAAAFSPPVPTDTLPADAVPVTLTEPSRYGSWLEQAVVLSSQEHEQEDV